MVPLELGKVSTMIQLGLVNKFDYHKDIKCSWILKMHSGR